MQVLAFFTNDGVPQPGLTPTVRIRDISDNSLVVTDLAASEVGDGWYKYDFAAYDSAKEYAIRFDGGATLADSDRYTSGTNDSFVDDITNGVWSDNLSSYNSGEAGDILNKILTATEIESAAINDTGASTTKFITTLTQTTNGFWTRASLLFTSGNNKGQIRAIKSYSGGTKEVTIQTPLSFQPIDGDFFIIIAARKFLTPDVLELVDAVFEEQINEHLTVGSFGYTINEINNDLKRVLGLMHHNIFIDNPVYDSGNNLVSARVRIYSAAGSVGTDSNVIGAYEVTADTDGIAGQFNSWKQIEI